MVSLLQETVGSLRNSAREPSGFLDLRFQMMLAVAFMAVLLAVSPSCLGSSGLSLVTSVALLKSFTTTP